MCDEDAAHGRLAVLQSGGARQWRQVADLNVRGGRQRWALEGFAMAFGEGLFVQRLDVPGCFPRTFQGAAVAAQAGLPLG
jgi:hypothetical protein